MSHRLRRALISALVLVLPSSSAQADWPPAGLPVSTETGDQAQMGCLADGAGGLYVVWTDQPTDEADIYLQHLLPDGSVASGWPTGGLAVCSARESQSIPELAPDGHGGVIVTWLDERASSESWEEYDIYAQRVNADGSIAWAEDGVAVCACPAQQYAPRIATDAAGGAYVTWEDERAPGHRIWLQRIGPEGSPASGWPAGGIVLGAPSPQRYGMVVPDGEGGALVTWLDSPWEHRVLRVTSAGQPAMGWSPEGTLIGTASAGRPARLAPGVDGGAFLMWDTYLGRVMVNSVTGTGEIATGWPPGGQPVAAGASVVGEAVAEDGAGGVVVAWTLDHELRATRMLPSGALAPGWGVGGTRVATPGPHWPTDTRILNASGAGSYFTWTEYSSPQSRVMLQRLDAEGSFPAGWSSEALNVGSTDQDFYPHIASDGAGGAMISWSSRRGADLDVFAQRVGASGLLDAGPAPGGESPMFAGFSPNPSRGGETVVAFRLPREGRTSLEVFDIAGRRVAEHRWSSLATGPHRISLGRSPLAAGVYVIRLRQGNEVRVGRGVVLR
jgi:hypothetical protein